MYYNRSVDPKKTVLLAIVAIVIGMAIFAQLDLQVNVRSPFDLPTEQRAYTNYILCITAIMFLFGGAAALVAYMSFQKSPLGQKLANIIILSTVILIVSGLEDFFYFIWAGGFPAPEVNWSWMVLQAKIFGGFWNTSSHILWMLFWLGLVLPGTLHYFFRGISSYKVKITTTKKRH